MTALDESRTCPDPLDLAAFLDGTLHEEGRRRIARHLEHCDRCMFAIAETSRFERERMPPPREIELTRPAWLMPLAAGFIIALLTAAVWFTTQRDPVRRLRAAVADAGVRDFEGRLSEFDYARHRAPRSNEPASPSIAAAANAVLRDAPKEDEARDWHAQGLAQLLTGQRADAVRALSEAVRLEPQSASYRSDLAAARIALGSEQLDADELRRALADAEAALQLEPKNLSALFNRAVAFERLRDRRAARAFADYLAADDRSRWAEEARWRMKRVGG